MSRSRRTLTLGLLVCITAVAFEGMAVVTAMPAAAADLGDAELYAWAFSAVMIPQLFAIAATGRIVDRTGPVRPLLIGLFVFAAGVVVAALAPTMIVLLVGRFVQGLGGGAVNLCLLVVTAQGCFYFTDSRYIEAANHLITGAEIATIDYYWLTSDIAPAAEKSSNA